MTDSSSLDSSRTSEGHSDSALSGSALSGSALSESRTSGDVDALLSFLQVIEDQPLDQRAPAFVQVYEKLRSALEVADTSA